MTGTTADRPLPRRRAGRDADRTANAAPVLDDHEVKRRAILEGAAEVFLRRGFSAGTTKEIAAVVGLSQPSLYHYVGSKDHLLREIALHVAHEVTAALAAGLGRSSEPAEQLRGVIEEFTEAVVRDRRSFAVFWQELHSLPSDLRDQIAQQERSYIAQVGKVIAQLQKAKRMPAGPVVVIAEAVLSMPSWMYHWYEPTGSLTAQQIAAVYCQLIGLTSDE